MLAGTLARQHVERKTAALNSDSSYVYTDSVTGKLVTVAIPLMDMLLKSFGPMNLSTIQAFTAIMNFRVWGTGKPD